MTFLFLWMFTGFIVWLSKVLFLGFGLLDIPGFFVLLILGPIILLYATFEVIVEVTQEGKDDK